MFLGGIVGKETVKYSYLGQKGPQVNAAGPLRGYYDSPGRI